MPVQNHNCDDIQAHINAMTAGQLQDLSREWIDQLETCSECQAHFEETLRLHNLLDTWEVPAPRNNIAAGVMADIAQWEHNQSNQGPRGWSSLRAFLIRRVPVSMAAMLLVLLSLAGSVGLNLIQRQDLTATRTEIAILRERATLPSENIITVGTPENLPLRQPARVVPASYQASTRSFFVNPQNMPSPLVIILGAPPMVSLDTEPATSTLTENRPL